MENPQQNSDVNASKVLGYLLLIPPIISIPLFLVQFALDHYHYPLNMFEDTVWAGAYGYSSSGGGGGYTSALPIYFGLMAIAGSMLIKEKK